MRPVAVAVVGGRKSGKTVTVEALARTLTRRGYSVAAVKHIPEREFTIDTKGKDTWRFAQAGATMIIAVSADEIVTIEKASKKKPTILKILQRCRGNDFVFFEGFKEQIKKRKDIQKIVVVKSRQEALDARRNFDPILAYSSSGKMSIADIRSPCMGPLVAHERLADIVENLLKRKGS